MESQSIFHPELNRSFTTQWFINQIHQHSKKLPATASYSTSSSRVLNSRDSSLSISGMGLNHSLHYESLLFLLIMILGNIYRGIPPIGRILESTILKGP